MKVPGWLFVVLSTISISLFVSLAVFIVWCIWCKSRRKRYPKGTHHEQRLILTPSVMQDSPLSYQTASFIPYTVPTIVQAPRYKSSSTSHQYDLHNTTSRYSRGEVFKAFDVSSCRSEPVINHVYSTEERFPLRCSPRHSDLLASHVTGSYKVHSPVSSRASSMRSERGDPPEIETKASTLTGKEVYLHSLLLDQNSLEQDYFIADDHIISYDQENEEDTKESNGALFLTLFYDQEASQLRITIRQATDLPVGSGREEELVTYINFCIVPEDFYWQKTASVRHTRHPVFNQTFTVPDVLHHKLRQYTLCFLVMNTTSLQETMLGKVMVPLSDLRAGMVLDMRKEIGLN